MMCSKVVKIGKQPGPDLIIMELHKWLNATNRQNFVGYILNEWWAHGEIPTELLQVRVAPIYRKGGIGDPSIHRPISLPIQSLCFTNPGTNTKSRGRDPVWPQTKKVYGPSNLSNSSASGLVRPEGG